MEEDGGEQWLITCPTNLGGSGIEPKPLGYKPGTLTLELKNYVRPVVAAWSLRLYNLTSMALDNE